MSDYILLNISTPEKLFFQGEIKSLVISSSIGKMGILPGHKPMVVALDTAPIEIETDEGAREAAIVGGYAQIKNNQVTILADTAEWPEDIEISRAVEAKKRAEERLQSHLSEVEFMRSQAALRRALLRLSLTRRN